MAAKKYDAAVKVREYTDSQGQTKAVWKNVGAVFQNDKGMYMVMDRTFNPAGVPNPDGKDSVLISLFTPEPKKPAREPGSDDDVPY